jgi:hypothetical protein
MKFYFVLFGTFLILNLAGCTSAAEKKDEAQAEYTEEKTETLKEYKECVKKSEGVEAKMAQCEALLKAVGAVEGGTVQSSAPAPAPVAPTENTAPAEEGGTPTDSQ